MSTVKTVFSLLFIFCLNLSAQLIDVYERPEQVERSRDFDVQHYRLELTFDLEHKKFGGENRVTLKPLKNSFRECVFDAQDLVITDVTDDNNISLKFNHTDHKLTIHFSQEYSYGEEVIFTIKYHAEDPPNGFFFSDETERNPLMISTDSWHSEARCWFPCYDYPHDKVTMELIGTVKQPNKILSNGKLVSITENENNTVTYHWHQLKPHSTYLSMVAVAPFAVIEDSLGSLPVNYWVYEQDVENARRIFKNTPAMIEYFNELYGYEYPWAKYDQVVTPTQPGGAEATSATILGENAIYDEKAEKDFSFERVIAHEVAHQWWGDLITMRTWSETWMNEGFGTYGDYLWSNHFNGDDEGAIALLNKKNAYLREAHEKYIRPIVFTRYEDPGDNFDGHTYPKGAAVLHMLRFVMGDERFFQTLSHFLHKHEFQAVDTHDFMIAVKEATGQNLDWFFEQYIYKPGHPVFDISYEWIEASNKVQLKVKQVQDFSVGVPVYTIPVIIGITTPEGKTSEKVWIKEKEEVFEFTVDEKPLLVRFDEGNYLLKEWTFDKSEEELFYQLKNDDVIGRMWAASELGKSETADAEKALHDSAVNDTFWAVRQAALEAAGKLDPQMDSELLQKYCKDENSKVRTSALRLLGDKRDPELIPFYKDQFDKEDSYLAQAEILRSIGKSGDTTQTSYLQNAGEMNSPRDVLKNAADWAVEELNGSD